jgi:hypothetical protein
VSGVEMFKNAAVTIDAAAPGQIRWEVKMPMLHNWIIIFLWAAGFLAAVVFQQMLVAGVLWAYPAGVGAGSAAVDLVTGCIRWKD